MDDPPLLVHVAIKENRRYPFEELFRSSLRHLADAALSETHFVTAFLHGADQSSPAVQSTLQAIFRRAFSARQAPNKLFACHDAVGLLLVVRLIERARTRATRGPAPTASALDAFLGDCEALVRPRLLTILSQNLEGVKKAELSRLGVVSTAPPPRRAPLRRAARHGVGALPRRAPRGRRARRGRGLAARESGGVAGVAGAAEDRRVRVAAVVGLEYRVRSDERRRVGGGAGRVVDGGAARAHGRIVVKTRAAPQEGRQRAFLAEDRHGRDPHLLDFCGEGRVGPQQ